MKINFSSVTSVVLSVLGIKSFAKDAKGKSVVSDAEKATLTEKFGAKFVENYVAELALHEADATALDPNELSEAQAQLEDMKVKLDAALADKDALQQTIDALSFDAEPDSAERIPVSKAGKKVAFKPDPKMMHNRVIENFFHGDRSMSYSTDETVNTNELQSEFGRYVSHEKIEILRRLTTDLTCTNYMTTVVTDLLEWKASQAIISSVLQQFTPFWTPKGTTKFTPITIKNFLLKVNVPIKPAEIIDQYIGYLYDEDQTPENMPIVKYIVDALIIPKLLEDLEEALATGKFVEHSPTQDGEAGSDAADSMDGYITILRALKAGSKQIGAWLLDGVTLTQANILEKMDLAVKEVSKNYRRKKLLVYADPDVCTMYGKAYRDKYPYTKNQDGEVLKIDFTNFTFQPVDGMLGTGVFFITPKENWKHLMSKNPNEAKIFMQVQNYDVKVFIHFRKGTGFAMQEALFAYLPPLSSSTDPEGSTGGGL
jgi:hypothetical protein